jgi:type II secretory pathway component GspD/PulD (secretin)
VTASSPPPATVSAAQPAIAASLPAVQSAAIAADAAGSLAKLVRLEFQDQKWLPVLEWIAAQRHLNLDWQQLPDGTLNLASSKQYTVDEAEDLINMQLLARGFTLLRRGEVLRIVPLKNIDVTLVPRVTPEELAKLPLHQFVRVTFPLEWMIADEAATELKPLVSPYGQLFPMASSNRLEAMDAVVNLREVHRLLTRAESDQTRRQRVAEFRLKHRKADEVAVKVRQLLGLPPDAAPPSAGTQQQLDIETAKFRAEAVKQLGANAQPLLKDKPDVHIVVNVEENSILVNGRPDKIEIARQAVEAMDKPEPPRESSWATFSRVKIYPLGGADAATITQLMQAIQGAGNIDKGTRISHDTTNNRLVVYASPQDQVTIAGIVESFHTEGRRAEVLPLAQIDAEYATKAIKLILKNPDRPLASTGAASDGRFQIEPDTRNNRLLLWATPTELGEVREFLRGLGETFGNGSTSTQLHVVPLRGAKGAAVAERLKRVWKEISDAPLVIEPGQNEPRAPEAPSPPAKAPAPAPASEANQKPEPMSDRIAARPAVQLASQQQPVSAPAGTPEPKPLPEAPAANPQKDTSVRVIPDNDELIIMSRDPVAAETARRFIEQVVPETADVQIISLKHAQAAQVKMQIDTMLAHTQMTTSSTLNTERPLVIEADTRTNRLMIQHATPRQTRLINQMIPLLDQPEQGGDRLVRKQQIYRAERKRASEIATIVKEVYRDLLSTSDKVFDVRAGYRPYGYNQALAATSRSPEYQGLLSVGVDDAGNILVLSAPSYLIDEVMQVVKLIDSNAEGEKVTVVPVSRAAQKNLGDALGRLLGQK